MKFVTHDNYNRPFVVYVTGKKATVYRQRWDMKKNMTVQNSSPTLQFTFKKLFPGKKSPWAKFPPLSFQKGNSLLFQLTDNTFLYIGREIGQFKSQKGDKILKYFSDIGNNDVPYPYAVGEKYIYFIIENAVMPRELIESLSKDMYAQYYKASIPKVVINENKDIKVKHEHKAIRFLRMMKGKKVKYENTGIRSLRMKTIRPRL